MSDEYIKPIAAAVEVPAYAKVNCGLRILGRAPNGMHRLDSVIAPVELHDTVTIEVGLGDGSIRLSVHGPYAHGIPTDSGNTAYRAARAVLDLCGDRELSISLDINKTIPSGAGLGGGSADAAAVLEAGARIAADIGVDVPTTWLLETAGQIGSDVPALTRRGWSRIGGVGEVVEALPGGELHLVAVMLGESNTKQAYAVYDGSTARRTEEEPWWSYLETHEGTFTFAEIQPFLPFPNDLELPVLTSHPALADGLFSLNRAYAAWKWQMTGSGGGVFACVPADSVASEVVARLRADGKTAFATSTRIG